MSTEVVMPQMGESIAEGTITKWLKKVGERVERDEPLFEISTDKVDAEIPSPAAGTLTEVRFKEGETVDVNTVVAVLDGNGAAPAETPAKAPVEESKPAAQASPKSEAPTISTAPPPAATQAKAPEPRSQPEKPISTAPPPAEKQQRPPAPPAASETTKDNGSAASAEDLRRTK